MTRWYAILVLMTGLCFTLGGHPAWATSPLQTLPSDPEAAWAKVEQDVLVELGARAAGATARAEARQAWFAQSAGDLNTAFPDLSNSELQSVVVVRGLVRALDEQGESRARERRVVLPDLGGAERTKQLNDAIGAALDAEERADSLQRRLLLAQQALLEDHPSLQRSRVDRLIAPWQRAVRAQAVGDDADQERIIEEAALADEELRRTEQLLGAVREAAWHGQAVATPEEDLLRLAQPGQAEGAAIRLALVAPLLTDAERERVQGVLDPIVEALARDTEALPELSASNAAERLAAVEARWQGAPAALQPLAQAKLDAARNKAAEVVVAPTTDSDELRAQAQAMQQRDSETAELLRSVADAQTAATAVTTDAATLHSLTIAEQVNRNDLATYQQALVRLRDPELRSTVNADKTYAGVRTLLGTLRKQARKGDSRMAALEPKAAAARKRLLVDAKRIAVEEAKLVDLEDGPVKEQRTKALGDWRIVIEQEEAAWTQELIDASTSREEALTALPGAAALRRGLRRYIGSEQRAADRAELVPELVDELSVMGPTYLATQRTRLRGMRDDPLWFLDLNLLYGVLTAGMWLMLAVALWWATRRYANGLVESALTRVADASDHIRPSDVVGLREPLHRVFVTLIDVCAAWLLFGMVPDGLPELGLLLVLVFEIQLVRLVLALFDVLVIRPPSVRPSLLRLSKEAWLTARRTVLAFALWFVLRRVLGAFASDVLHGFASEQLVALIAYLAFFVLVIVFLYAWAPHTRRRVGLHPGQSWITNLLGNKPPTRILGGPQALGGMVFLAFVVLRDLLFRVARSGVGPLGVFAAFDRFRLGRRGEEEAEPEPLTEEIRQALRSAGRERDVVDRTKAREQMTAALEGWRKESRQGLVALLGDDGDGRATALRTWEIAWQGRELIVHRVSLDRRLTTEADALDWLFRALELPRMPQDADDAVTLMRETLEPGIWILERTNQAFLRTVGGFGAFQTLLYVLHGDGTDRFWVVSLYRPAWTYLQNLSSLFSLHMFRAVIDLPPLNAKDLQNLMARMAERAGFGLNFDGLVSRGALAGAPEVEAQRAVDSFYRLLTAASAGNPAVAMDLWLSCLSLGEPVDGRPVLVVHIDRSITVAPVPDVSDDQLFVLAALRTQGLLLETEVAEVTNMNPFQVRAILRSLEGRGILQRQAAEVHIVRHQLPAVTLTLRRRHFLHWG